MPKKLLSIIVLFFMASTGSVWAVDIHWQGTVSCAWNNPANWDGGAVPTTVDKAILINTPGPIIDSTTTIQTDGAMLDEITIQHQPHIDGDFNEDSRVDMLDVGIFAGNWLKTGIWP